MCIEGSDVRVDKFDHAKTDAAPFNVLNANIIGFDSSANPFMRIKREFRKYKLSDEAKKAVSGPLVVPLCRRAVRVPTTYTSQNPAQYIKAFEQIKSGREYASSHIHSH